MAAKYINPYTDFGFKKLFDIAEISHLKPKQYEAYQKSLLEYWEVKNVMDTSFEEGLAEGLAEGELRGEIKGELKGVKKVAKAMKEQQVDIKIIIATTGLTLKEIESL